MPFLPTQMYRSPNRYTLTVADDIDRFQNGPNPINVIRWGLILTTACDVAAFVCKLDHLQFNKTGGDNRSDGSGGFNMAITTDIDIGSVPYVTYGGDKDSSSLDATGGSVIKPGDHLVWQVISPMDTGDGYTFLEYQILGFDSVGPVAQFSEEDGTDASRRKLFNASVAI